MLFLFLSVLFNTLIFLVFKLLPLRKSNVYRVVVLNYFIAAIAAYVLSGSPDLTATISTEFFIPAAILGMFFVFVFYLMAFTTSEAGLSKAVVSNKLSLVLPVLMAYYLYNESFSMLKVVGILLSLPGIYLMVSNKDKSVSTKGMWFILSLFLASGVIDSSLKLIQHYWLNEGWELTFTSVIFFFAFITGAVTLPFFKMKKDEKKYRSDVFYGILLGAINVGSIFTLVKALQLPGLESSFVFPINNLMVIFFSSILAYLIFKERLSARNKMGVLIAMISLVFLFLSNFKV